MTPKPSALDFVRQASGGSLAVLAAEVENSPEVTERDAWAKWLRALAQHRDEILRALEVAEAVAWCEETNVDAQRFDSACIHDEGGNQDSPRWIVYHGTGQSRKQGDGDTLPAAVAALRAKIGEGK